MAPKTELHASFAAYDSPNSVGGPTSWLIRLLPELANYGIRARCLALCWGDEGPLVSALRRNQVPCVQTVCQGTTDARMLWVLDRLMANPADVFIPNLVIPAFFAARWVREAGIPTVGVLHSDDPFYKAVRDEFVCGRAEFALSEVVCVSRELQQQTLATGPKHTHVERIPYGVNIPEQTVERVPGRLRIAYVGRLAEEQKCISEVTKALIRVTLDIPNVEAEIIGDGCDRANVESILAAADDRMRVRLAGRLSPDEVQKKLADIDVIVLLSDYEGLPVALLEAMGAGVVPVCMNMRSGIPELVRHLETGLIVHDREDDFVAAIRLLHEDLSLWQRLSAAARTAIVAEYSHDASVKRWASLIHSLAAESRRTLPIRIPSVFDLPPVNPALAAEDFRWPTTPRRGIGERAVQLAQRFGHSLLRTAGWK